MQIIITDSLLSISKIEHKLFGKNLKAEKGNKYDFLNFYNRVFNSLKLNLEEEGKVVEDKIDKVAVPD